MRITVIGWFGTETIGDRAIVAGILNVLSNFDDNIFLDWGSVFVPLTERSWREDASFYTKITGDKLKGCEIFYSCNRAELEKHIRRSDILLIGGGPLIEAQLMYMLKYAFIYAKKHNIKTIAFGCGWGPLKLPEYIKVSKEIIELSDLAFFRDTISVDEYLKCGSKNNSPVPLGLIDPAFFAAQFYRENASVSTSGDFIAVNFRESFVTQNRTNNNFSYQDCIDIINGFLNTYPSLPIRLIPMHTFHIGGDDRIVSNKLAQIINDKRVRVQNEPLSLEETMATYYNAYACCGMRFHAVLLQSVLNGKNYILDYTEAQKGKIIGLLRQLGLTEEFNGRYVSCENIYSLNIEKDVKKIQISDEVINSYKLQYINSVNKLLS